MIAAAGLALACDSWLAGHPLTLFGGSLKTTWSRPISMKLVWQHVMMLGHFDAEQIDTVLWSLPQETRISILYPLIALAVLKLRRRKLLALVIAIEPGYWQFPSSFPTRT